MKNAFLRWWGCGAFDVILGDVNFAFDPYLFDENLENAEPIYDYIFISHEHFDHCHPKTLRKLCRGSRFKKLFVNPGCITPKQPVDKNYGDAAFERDLPITKHVPADKVQILYPKHLNESQGLDREFAGPFEVALGAIHVETIESGENQEPNLPTCGYLVTHKEKDISFLHTGDLHAAYPALKNIKGKVDFLIHMKLGLIDGGSANLSPVLTELLELVAPRFLIPTHYRTDRITDPIPEGHWPPNVTDAMAFIEWIRQTVGGKTEVLPFTAGVEYELELPAKQVLWKWNWFNTWTVPPWRAG
jgi:L-ascorbate metabolism protein UlaG (beta-lactamase superfamily)